MNTNKLLDDLKPYTPALTWSPVICKWYVVLWDWDAATFYADDIDGALQQALAAVAVQAEDMFTDDVICPICETTHRPDEVEFIGSGQANDHVSWSKWRCLLTDETWDHLEPVPAEVVG